jgi:hypothetical protein
MFEGTVSALNMFPQTALANPSKLRIYICAEFLM